MGKKRSPGTAPERPDFDGFYRTIYGDRWDALKRAMEAENPTEPFRESPLMKPYFLDPASVQAAHALGAGENDSVLDLCAAPGGKALVLVSMLGRGGRLTVNERSGDRRARLVRVLREHLPPEVADSIRVTGHDAAAWGLHERDAYDRILLDVPCSSERHVLRSPAHLAVWSPARTKHLSIQAYAMLASAFLALKPGGRILYSTCSLSPLENDRVVGKLLDKKKGKVVVEKNPADGAEETEFGCIVLPDTALGKGPLFWAAIRKLDD